MSTNTEPKIFFESKLRTALYCSIVFVLSTPCFQRVPIAYAAEVVAVIPTGVYGSALAAAAGKIFFLHDDQLDIIDTTENIVEQSLSLGGYTPSAFFENGVNVYMTASVYGEGSPPDFLFKIDTDNDNTLSTISVPTYSSPLGRINDSIILLAENGTDFITFNVDTETAETVVLSGMTAYCGSNRTVVINSKIYCVGSMSIDSVDMENNFSVSSHSVDLIDGIGSHPTAVLAAGNKIYIGYQGVGIGRTTLYVFNTDNNELKSLTYGEDHNVYEIISTDEKIYARSTGDVIVVDRVTDATSTVAITSVLNDMVISEGMVYITIPSSDKVFTIKNSNLSTSTISLAPGTSPRFAASLNHNIYVYGDGNYTISVIRPDDIIPPSIYGSTTSNITSTSATIGWQTDETASTSIAYGLTTSYENISTSTNTTTSHTVTLSGLMADTVYHYRILATDASGNIATTTDATFRTAVAPVIVVQTAPVVAIGPIGGSGGGASSVQPVFYQQPVVSPSPIILSQTIKNTYVQGKKAQEIKIIQQILNSDSSTLLSKTGAGSPGKETGFYGPATRAAVGKFQLKYGIVKSVKDPGFGVVGPKTLKKMNELLKQK